MTEEFEVYKPKREDEEQIPPVEIPPGTLTADALTGVIDNFIQREGTDYGLNELDHETKVKKLRQGLDRGDYKIVFDPNTESVTFMTKNDWIKLQRQSGTS